MIEPSDPERETPEPMPADPSSIAGPPGAGAAEDGEPMIASTVADRPAADVTRILPPATVFMTGASSPAASELGSLNAQSDQSPATVPDEIGALIDRPAMVAGYEILGVLGRGTMGVVYRARQRGLNRVVALKMIRGSEHSGPDELARFRGEANALAELQHPSIVQIYEVGEERGQPFFSLEYVQGGSLAQKIGGVPQPPAVAAPWYRHSPTPWNPPIAWASCTAT